MKNSQVSGAFSSSKTAFNSSLPILTLSSVIRLLLYSYHKPNGFALTNADSLQGVDYSTYEGMKQKGRPDKVFLRGELVADCGKYVGIVTFSCFNITLSIIIAPSHIVLFMIRLYTAKSKKSLSIIAVKYEIIAFYKEVNVFSSADAEP